MYFAMTALFALGVAVALGCLLLLICNIVESIYFKVTGRLRLKKIKKISEYKKEPVRYLKELKENAIRSKDMVRVSVIAVALAIFGCWLTPRLKLFGVTTGISIGLIAYSWLDKYKTKGVRLQKLRDIITIYDALAVYIPLGKNLQTVLENVVPLLKAIRTPVENCLKVYPYNPKEAILSLENSCDIEEAGLLVSVLLQVSSTGRFELSGPEGSRLENIRTSFHETRQEMLPMHNQLVNLIPFMVGVSIAIYVMGKHAVDMINSFKSTQFIK